MIKPDVQAVRAYYHTILPFYEEETANLPDLGFWRNLAKELAPSCVLELGAGAGRVTAIMAEHATVVALDLSHEMLQYAVRHLSWARDRVAQFAVYPVVGDMRRFAFASRFPLIVAPNDPFAHFTQQRDRITALRRVAEHLAPDGRFVLDGLYLPVRTSIAVRHPAASITVDETWTPVGHTAEWRAEYRYRRSGHQQAASFLARSWDAESLDSTFQRAGLQILHRWGEYDRSRFRPDASRLIVVAISSGSERKKRGQIPPARPS